MTWEELESQCKGCRECPLCETRTNVVFGVGSREADVLFVGEAPGQHEDETGIPFVGAAGKLLDRFLLATGIEKEKTYIANILKCRPPKNRDPLPSEEDACIGYLREQVRLIRPKIIICLGRISAMRLIKPDFKITKEHGMFFHKGEYVLTAVYHPAALLRDPGKKEDMYLDLVKISNYIKSMEA